MDGLSDEQRLKGRGILLIEHIPSVHHDAPQNHYLLLGGSNKPVFVPVVGIFANEF